MLRVTRPSRALCQLDLVVGVLALVSSVLVYQIEQDVMDEDPRQSHGAYPTCASKTE